MEKLIKDFSRLKFLLEQNELDLEKPDYVRVKLLINLDFWQSIELNLFEGKVIYDEDLSNFFAINKPKIFHPYMVLVNAKNIEIMMNKICYEFEIFRIIFSYSENPSLTLPISLEDLKNKLIENKDLVSKEKFKLWREKMKSKYGRVPFRVYLIYNVNTGEVLDFNNFYSELLKNLEPR